MRELGLYDLTPAMCHLDYTMAEIGGAADFVREYTLASGDPYCDCGYKKKVQDRCDYKNGQTIIDMKTARFDRRRAVFVWRFRMCENNAVIRNEKYTWPFA